LQQITEVVLADDDVGVGCVANEVVGDELEQQATIDADFVARAGAQPGK
jgi:hypothetical protein